VLVQAFVAGLPIQARDDGVLDGHSGPDEAQAHAGALRPFEHRSARTLGAVIEDDLLGQADGLNSPILACGVFTSTVGAASVLAASPKTPDAPSRSCERHCVIRFGCSSNCCAS
jgi:hypothetical protein